MSDLIGLLGKLPELLQALVIVVGALSSFVASLIVVAKLIPGDFPDAQLQKFADFLSGLIKK